MKQDDSFLNNIYDSLENYEENNIHGSGRRRMSFGQETVEIKKNEEDQFFFKENNFEEKKDYDDLFFRISLEESQKKQMNDQYENPITIQSKTKEITNTVVENQTVLSIFETESSKNHNKTCELKKNCEEMKNIFEENKNILEENKQKNLEENDQSFKLNNDEISKKIDLLAINDNSFELNFDLKEILSLSEEKNSASK